MPRPVIEFWFDFASTYTYLSAMRIETLADTHGVDVIWRPFLLGPIFRAQGWDTSPFNLYPAKGTYMWLDVARRADALGLNFVQPDPFPQNSLLAARTACHLPDGPQLASFCRHVFDAEFARGQNISDPQVISACLEAAGLQSSAVETASDDSTKSALRARTDIAAQRGLFGAPSFFVANELFWGDDRLEDALRRAVPEAGDTTTGSSNDRK